MVHLKRLLGAVGAGAVLAGLVLQPLHGLAQDGRAARTDASGGVLVRVDGDVTLGAGEREGVVVVVEGDATIAGAAEVVVVVGGTARLVGARVAELVVVQGAAELDADAVVAGDVHLVDAEMTRAEGAAVLGEVHYDAWRPFGRGLLIFGVLFALGMAVAVLLSGVVAAAVAPEAMRAAGATLTNAFGPTLLGTLFVWVGLPVVATLAFATVVGIPVGLGILVVLLPALAFLGYLVAGIRLGDYVVETIRSHGEAVRHPYLAALAGLGLLLVAGGLPIVGSVVTPVAAFLGSGAVAVRAWRTVRPPRRRVAAMSAG